MHLDLYTLGVIGLAVGVTISLSFTLLGTVLGGLPALRIWAVAFWVMTVGVLAQGLDESGSALSAIAGNGLIALSNALMLMGIAVHVRYPLRWRWPLAVVAVYVAVQIGYVLMPPARPVERLTFGAHSILWDAWMIWILLRRSPRDLRISCGFTAMVFGIDMAFYLARSLAVLFPDTGSHVLLASLLVMANYMFSILCIFLVSTGFTLMLAQRLTLDLRRMARIDGLTGLLNHTAVLEEGRRAIDACRTRRQACSVLVFDLDHFKTINDSWGHAAGDVVLRHFVAVIRGDGLPPDALFARHGGEEFVLVLPAVDAAKAAMLAEQWRARLARLPAVFERQRITVTTSVGVAAVTASMGFEALVSAADKALYRAKHLGRNRVEWAEDAAVTLVCAEG